jgi:dolichol-phosphate mannosyltransferase
VLDTSYRTLAQEARTWKESVELIFVDDGSKDDTWQVIERLARRDCRVRGVRMSRNFGHQAAIGAGLEQATGDAVVVLDADLQDPPKLVGEMIARWHEGFDVVAARRKRRQGESAVKKVLGYFFYRFLARITNVPILTDTGDFALLDRRVVDVMLGCEEHALFWRGLRCYAGFRHTFVEFERPSRAAGTSKYTLRKLMGLASNGIFSFSEVPLRLGLYLGMITLVGCLLLTLGSLAFSLATGSTPLFSPLFVLVFLLGSAQLLCMGIIGEYLNRIYAEVRRRPRWIVSEMIGMEEQKGPSLRAA